MRSVVLWSLLASPAFTQGIAIDHSCVDETDQVLPSRSLDKARSLDVLFGHQSVGENILDGLRLLAERDRRYACERASEPDPEWFAANDGIGDFAVGENEDPRGKIRHFVRKLRDDGCGKRVSVAMMKLCFVDFGEDRDVALAVYESYGTAMADLERAFPKVRFVWWTAPLMVSGNEARHAYNEKVRKFCASSGRILFDLADIESHDPKGQAQVENGIPVLYAKYAEDEGHLNEAGRLRVARAWWWLMARLEGWDGKRK